MRDDRKLGSVFFFNLELEPPELVGFTLTFDREGDQWVGICVELGTSTYGPDLAALEDELIELVLFDLNALEAEGERQDFFARHGIQTQPVPGHLQEHLLAALRPEPEPAPAIPITAWLPQRQAETTPAVALAHPASHSPLTTDH